MPAAENFAYDDELLTRYLLGELSAEQAEKLDELSVSDDAFVWRLSGVENDLVDSFVRGELHGETLKRFRSFYLSSVLRRQKVEFAVGLRALMDHAEENVKAHIPPAAGRSLW